MFDAPRQLFRRNSRLGRNGTAAPAKAEARPADGVRHPAMRGIDVSPVHGRHCICARCDQQSKAA